MRELPAGLPPANSRKWHSRRWWDGLGYIRARTLSNPAWVRDVDWVKQVAVRQRASADSDEYEQYDAIIATLRRYPKTARGDQDADATWEEVLSAIDELSLLRQARHLAAVKAAQASRAVD